MGTPEDRRESHLADPQWFRAPTRREYWIATGIFLGFGIFFLLLFLLHQGWWFRWFILGLAVASIWYAARHLRGARRSEQ